MVPAHIAGVPVEETLLSFVPLGLAGVGALAAYASQRVRAWRHPRTRRRAGPGC
jgi:hypothetical protein